MSTTCLWSYVSYSVERKAQNMPCLSRSGCAGAPGVSAGAEAGRTAARPASRVRSAWSVLLTSQYGQQSTTSRARLAGFT